MSLVLEKTIAKGELLSGQKLELLNRWDNAHRRKYGMSLLTQNELRSLSVMSLYRLSLKETEYRINRIFKKYKKMRSK